MKVYSIGREVGCDIVINDRTDVISRRHAILNVLPSGKMTIVDQSSNGTYVNGIRISPNVPVPVSRKDNISFAHIARLDWNMIPKPKSPMLYVAIGIASLAILGGIGYGAYYIGSGNNNKGTLPNDTTSVVKKDSITDKKDSLKTEKQKDTSTKKITKKKNIEKKKENDKKKENNKKKEGNENKKKDNDKKSETVRTDR